MARVVSKVKEAWKKLTNVNRSIQVGSSLETSSDVNGIESAKGYIALGEEAFTVIDDTCYHHSSAQTTVVDDDDHHDDVVCVSETALEVRRETLDLVKANCDDSCDDDHVSSDLTEYHGTGLSPTEIQILANEIREKADVEYPPFYDFCIIASEEDYETANSFKIYLCRTFDLRGCMLNDGFYRPGSDIFLSFELMMSRSTKILFYLTETFTANHFYRRLQSAAVFQSLMSHVRLHREKCVPVFPNGMVGYVPLPLVGIAGLCPLFESVFQLSVKSSFTTQVKERRRLLNVSNNESRREFYLQELKLTIQKQAALKSGGEMSVSNGHGALASESAALPSGTEGNGELVKAFSTLPIAPSEKNSLLQQVSALTEIASTNVQVKDSNNVHVGPQVIVNVMVNSSVGYNDGNQNDEDNSCGESDHDTSCDECGHDNSCGESDD